jgi:hypothetical protein
MGPEESEVMDSGVVKHTKIAKGKKLYTTQLPIELLDELKTFSEEINIPMTTIVEKYIEYGLAKSKAEGTLPVYPRKIDKE